MTKKESNLYLFYMDNLKLYGQNKVDKTAKMGRLKEWHSS